MRAIDLTGRKFGRLTVIERSENKYERVAWLCECECGNRIVITGTALRSGNTKSCGCLFHEKITKHGMHKSRLYKVWANMISRCYTPSASHFMNYGARGIRVCDAWRTDFTAFKNWALANGYEENAERGICTLDRIDVNGNYCPENCRWTTNLEQQNNRQNNKVIVLGSEKHTVAEWERMLGIKKGNLRFMLKKKSLKEIVEGVEA